jgi:hypothetical protein
MQRTLLAWLPILGLAVIQLIPSSYWCTLIEPGGKEFVCDYEYSHVSIKLAVDAYMLFSVIAFAVSIWYAYQKRLSKVGIIGVVISALLAIVLVWVKISYGNDDSP